MTILNWAKPDKIMTTEERSKISADGAPPGVYVSNISNKDLVKWKAKITGQKKARPQVEIRRNYMVLIVSLGEGYNYKGRGKAGVNVHLSTSGAQLFTFEEFNQMNKAVQEARNMLLKLKEENDLVVKEKSIETNSAQIDTESPTANMYGCEPCPRCNSKYRAAFEMENSMRLRIECDDCGYKENATVAVIK